ncbi:MAG: tripartite tricarboxylate transporter substrate binding protein [Rhodocyclaceae bacterium]|nr:tripartite tricarboxylate transporter substrate binding protein [Rhodocyclaceae bacterium]
MNRMRMTTTGRAARSAARSANFWAPALLLCPALAAAQPAWPSKPIRLIVPLAPGGNQDLIARNVMQRVAVEVGQPVVVENRPGVGGVVGSEVVARGPADGYQWLSISNTFVTVPSVLPNVPYDPVKDFVTASVIANIPQVLVVNPAMPVKTVQDVVKLAKARPGQVNVAMSGSGSTGHIASVGFTRAAGIEVTYVPYKGNALALIDVMGGHVSVLFDQVSTSIPLIRSGKVRALGVTSTRRSVLLADVPTIAESGLPGYEAATFNAVLAPAAVPAAIVSRMHAAIAAAVKQPDLRGRMAELGIELMANASPEEATAFVRSEVARMARLVKEAGIKAD